MPNHCCNTLVMSRATLPVVLDNYIREHGNGELFFDFEEIIPVGDIPVWHDQSREKWGTKWPGYDVSVEEDRIQFYTARFPPIPIIQGLARLHHDYVFHLEYYETGDNFRGEITARWNGREVVSDSRCWEMTKTDYEELGLLADEE